MFTRLREKRLPPLVKLAVILRSRTQCDFRAWGLCHGRNGNPTRSSSNHFPNIARTIQKLLSLAKQNLFEAIPDGALPFRGFVKALACPLKLGVVSQTVAQLCIQKNSLSLDGQKGKRQYLRVCQTSCLLGREYHGRVGFPPNYQFAWATWHSLEKMRSGSYLS